VHADAVRALRRVSTAVRQLGVVTAALTPGAVTTRGVLQGPFAVAAPRLFSPFGAKVEACKPTASVACVAHTCTAVQDFSACDAMAGSLERTFAGNFSDGTYKLTLVFRDYAEGASTAAGYLRLDGTAVVTGVIGENQAELHVVTQLQAVYREGGALVTTAWQSDLAVVARDGKVTLDGAQHGAGDVLRLSQVVFDGACKQGPVAGGIDVQLPSGDAHVIIVRCGAGTVGGEELTPGDFGSGWTSADDGAEAAGAARPEALLLGRWHEVNPRFEAPELTVLASDGWFTFAPGGGADRFTLDYLGFSDYDGDGSFTSQGDWRAVVSGDLRAAGGHIYLSNDTRTFDAYDVTTATYKPYGGQVEPITNWAYRFVDNDTLIWTATYATTTSTVPYDFTLQRVY
jgi:hypothetical protein